MNDEKTHGFGVDLPLGCDGATCLMGRRGLNDNAVAAKTFLQLVEANTRRSERKGGCIAAGNPPAYPLRVNRAAQ